MNRPRLDQHLTLREIALAHGWPTSRSALRRLRKRLLRRQALCGTTFLHQLGPGPNSPLVTTTALLRQHCPEMFDTPKEALNLVADFIQQQRETIRKQNQEIASLRNRVRKLEPAKSGPK